MGGVTVSKNQKIVVVILLVCITGFFAYSWFAQKQAESKAIQSREDKSRVDLFGAKYAIKLKERRLESKKEFVHETRMMLAEKGGDPALVEDDLREIDELETGLRKLKMYLDKAKSSEGDRKQEFLDKIDELLAELP